MDPLPLHTDVYKCSFLPSTLTMMVIFLNSSYRQVLQLGATSCTESCLEGVIPQHVREERRSGGPERERVDTLITPKCIKLPVLLSPWLGVLNETPQFNTRTPSHNLKLYKERGSAYLKMAYPIQKLELPLEQQQGTGIPSWTKIIT